MTNETSTPCCSERISIDWESFDRAVETSKLLELCQEADIEVDASVAEKLVNYLELVLKKNEVLNLTAIREWDKALVLHLVDSLTLLIEFDEQPRGQQLKPFLDMGCGAGFPGIPLALVRPERKGVLCDSVKKKIKAVDGFIEALDLQAQLSTTTERLEVFGTNHRRAFGCVTARAVAPLPVLIEYAAPLLAKHGRLIVSKGVPTEEEFMSGIKAAELCGLEVISQRFLDLPREFGQRTIIVYEKVDEPLVELPRQIGAATKEPLA